MWLDVTTINKIKKCLVEVVEPSKIFIFGSYASGHADANSDIDIAVITSAGLATRANLIQSRLALREALKGSGLAIDLILQSNEVFEVARKQEGSIQSVIASEGQLIYERQENEAC